MRCFLLNFLSSSVTSLVACSDVGCKTVANMIKGKTPEEIRKLFNIVNDFTPEEEVTFFLLLDSLALLNCFIFFIIFTYLGPNQEGERE